MPVTQGDYLFNPAGADTLGSYTLPAVFADAVAAAADQPAVFSDGTSYSFGQWAAEVDALTRGLQVHGVRPGDVVAAQLPSGRQFLSVHLAVAAAGAVFLPLHRGSGPADVSSLLSRAGATLFLSATPAAGALTPADLDALVTQWSGQRPEPVDVRPGDPMALLASSGSTSSRPKLCLHSHDGLLTNAAALAANAGCEQPDVLLSASPLSHLYGLSTMHMALFARCAQAVLPRWDARDFVELADRTGATIAFAVPTQLADILSEIDRSGATLRLRQVRVSGAAVPVTLADRARRSLGAWVPVQWGMSEVGGGLVTDADEPATGTIGRPVTGGEVRVVADNGTDTEDGATGHLLYRAPFLFRGYFGEPELTAAAVNPDGWLRTGDLACRNPDGTIGFRGRAVEQIVCGGLKISVTEVEEALADLPGVRTLAVVARPDPRLGEIACLVVTMQPGERITLDTVHGHLRAAGLARYKWPHELRFLDDLPVGLTGKIARPRISAMLAPLDLVRKHLAEILGRAVPADRAELRFVDLGVDSLQAVRLRNEIAEATGLDLPSTVLWDHPSPAELAQYLGGNLTESASTGIEETDDDPIAVVGLSCRFPGGIDSPDDLWRLLSEGGDATSGFPVDRGWDLDRLRTTSTTQRGAFLRTPGNFDAEFFGISPREAAAMDPQQRLLLELAWEALERAGIDPTTLNGTSTAVFAGLMAQNYARGYESSQTHGGHLLTGSAASVASGRIAYALGLRGPALTLDTACSSSLVALHLAVQSLRRGETRLALAGGATVMATQDVFVLFSRQLALSPDGRSKAFGASADGTSWAEGAGWLVLERLSDARRHGHPVLALVRGTAVNQDGTSNGLTAPNGTAQQQVIRQALADADLEPSEVDVVEGHGSGTSLGDPIEAAAIIASYGRDRTGPLLLGSVKSNLGHAQAAAGVASAIKLIMAMRHATVPATLYADPPSPHVDWSSGAVRLATATTPWPQTDRPRRAGVSAFGISGTNAHVILEQPDEPDRRPAHSELTPIPFVLSAKNAPALRAQASRLRDWHPEHSAAEIGSALSSTRSWFDHRAVVLAGDRTELAAGLDALAGGREAPNLVLGTRHSGGTAFMFTGQGAQRLGAGRSLSTAFPEFAKALGTVCDALDAELDRPLREVMFAEPGSAEAALLDATGYTQPALFALEVALFRLLVSLGLEPDVLIGHSIGELAAAHCAGVLDLPDAARLVAARGRLMQALPPGGAMLAVAASEHDVRAALVGREHDVAVAAVNGPNAVVVSGEEAAIEELAEVWVGQGRKIHRLTVSHASHSHRMDGMIAGFGTLAHRITFRPPGIPIISTLSGARGEPMDAGYWLRQVREPVRFADAIRTAEADGICRFVELGPDGVLTALAAGTAQTARCVPTLRGGRPEVDTLLAGLAELHVDGARVDWTRLFTEAAPAVELPTYAFQHQRYWLPSRSGAGDVVGLGLEPTGHPLLGAAVALADGSGMVFTGRLSRRLQPWLADHTVVGRTLVPGAALVELVAHAGATAGTPVVDELVLQSPLVLPDSGSLRLQTTVSGPDGNGDRSVTIHSAPDGEPWTVHAVGTLAPARSVDASTVAVWPPADAVPIDTTTAYAELADRGLDYGPAFQGLQQLWRAGDSMYAEIATSAEVDGFGLHPALLDGALHPLALMATESETGRPQVPFVWRGVSLHASGATALRVVLTTGPAGTPTIRITDPTGSLVATVDSLTTRELAAVANELYRVDWVPVDPGATRPRLGALGKELPGLATVVYPDLDALLTASNPPECVLLPCLSPSDPGPATERALELLQRWLAEDRLAQVPLVVVTRGAVATAATEDVPDLGNAPVWGLVRTAQNEYPNRLRLVDLDELPSTITALPGALTNGEPQVAIRNGTLLVPRLAKAAHPVEPGVLDPGGTFLITGANGALGRLVSRRLVTEHGVRRLVLTGRRGAPQLADELTALGAEAQSVPCDVADPVALDALLAGIPDTQPLTGIVHIAGVLEDGTLSSLSAASLRTVARPKMDAGWLLHQRSLDRPVSTFVLFSSLAATLGTPGQANYAAANAYLDALAQHRGAQGLPATSIIWGRWDLDDGMTGRFGAADRVRMDGSGVTGLSAEAGLALFDAALVSPDPAPIAARFGFAALRSRAEHGVLPSMFRGLVPATPARLGTSTGMRWQPGLDVAELVRSQLAAVLGHAGADAIDLDRQFLELGLDSLTTVELSSRLGSATGLELPRTIAFDHPTGAELAAHLRSQLDADPETASPARSARASDLPSLYRQALDRDRFDVGERLLSAAVELHPRSDSEEPGPVTLADGAAEPVLVCFPSLMALSGPHQFARLAAQFRGRRTLVAVPSPGFTGGEPLPATLPDFVRAQADAVLLAVGNRSFSLAGYSSGGFTAAAVADELAARDRAAASVVLIDTFDPEVSREPELRSMVIRGIFDRDETNGMVDGQRLTAMFGYQRLFGFWTPPDPTAPTLFVAAAEPVRDPTRTSAELRARWPLPHTRVEVPGNHFTILDDHAAAVADTIERWLVDP